MAKNINEKTFELNITNELLNFSKSFVWYLDYSPLAHLMPRNTWIEFLNQSTFFCEGLTQQEESNIYTGGYDVSINGILPNGLEGRLMFLQYKAGVEIKYSTKKESSFYRQNAKSKGISSKHILFTFNDAADGKQHSTLRNLSNKPNISPESVMYVFPRITDRADFKSKIGSLIYNSSFIPVINIDEQAENQNPSLFINDGVTHKFRTSYDGHTSEVNFFFFFYYYDNFIILDMLAELINIQIERFIKIIKQENREALDPFLEMLPKAIDDFTSNELKHFQGKQMIIEIVNTYVRKLKDNLDSRDTLPASSKYTMIVPEDGLTINFENQMDFSTIKYQIF